MHCKFKQAEINITTPLAFLKKISTSKDTDFVYSEVTQHPTFDYFIPQFRFAYWGLFTFSHSVAKSLLYYGSTK
jgi:hypothetical protein